MMATIIIPVVKDRGYLTEAIESAKAQDFQDYEIILASDGNPEMKNIADKHGIRFSLAKRMNLSHNYNQAAKVAKGKFIKPLADDDMLAPNCLSDLCNNIGNHSLIYAGAINFTKDKSDIYMPTPASLKDLIAKRSSNIHGGSVLMRKDIFLSLGGWDESIDCCEDLEYYLHLLTKGHTFTYVNKVVYYYRRHSGQKSRDNKIHRDMFKTYLINKYRCE
jgi:glycosyltransferase involved in cell wall biosynthesis